MTQMARHAVLGLMLVALGHRAPAELPKADASRVEAVLRNSYENHNLMLLRPALNDFTTNDLPVFATFLPTRLGFVAYHAMTELDAEASVPLFVQYLTNANHNAQSRILKLFASRLDRQGFPRAQVHSLVRQAIRDGHVPTYHALLTLATFNDPSDIPLIKSSGDIESESVRWAAARLGDVNCLAEVALRIEPPTPGSPEYEQVRPWRKYMNELGRAEWIGRPELIPVLIQNLGLREQRFIASEFLFPSPSSVALRALQVIVPVADQPTEPDDPDAWEEWWRQKEKLEQEPPTTAS